MNRYLLKKKLFCVLFLPALFGFSFLNFIHSYEPLKEQVVGQLADGYEITAEEIAGLETVMTENLYGRMNFIETHAYVQTLMDRRESNNFSYVKDEAGFLHYASFYMDDDTRIFEYAMRVKKLQDSVEAEGTKVLFVVTPGKYVEEYVELREGLPINNPNWIVDEMLFHLNRLGIETLDLRNYLPNDEISYDETFFKTDHHWTIPAAFYATDVLVDKIAESFGENLDPDDYYTNIENYDVLTYKGGMLGSMGRKTGVNFCEVEDFTAVWPRFEGQFFRLSMTDAGDYREQNGSFIEALMQPSILENRTDIYQDSQYSLYLGGLRSYEQIINEENPEGCKIFMIRDSYFSPVMAFMAPMCGRIDSIWSLEETEVLDVETYLEDNSFDYIIVEVYPYNINSSAFNFFKEEQ